MKHCRKKMQETFRSLDSDVLKWQFIFNNRSIINEDESITIFLDNDDTYITFGVVDEDGDEIIESFDYFVGCSFGVLKLFQALGLQVEEV